METGPVDQRQAQGLHIRKMVVQGGGGQPRLAGHLAQPQTVQAAPVGHQTAGGVQDPLAGLLFLLLPGTFAHFTNTR